MRRVIVAVAALLVGIQVVRNAAVADLAELHPDSAAKYWAAHPAVEISQGMAQIGKASRERRAIDRKTFALFETAAVQSPLSPEPYLVRGVQLQLAGDWTNAEKAFQAAQWRDPRSPPAAFFLADYYLTTGNALEGLQQLAVLARLSQGGTDAAAPYLAQYARDRANWPHMRALFRSQPSLEPNVLVALAKDASNADAVTALASAQYRKPNAIWLSVLLSSLVNAGDYGRARAIWESIGRGGSSRSLITDADFSDAVSPPPFNWSLAGSTVGLAERQPGKQMHVIFYGNEDGTLASQLLTLPAGNYRLQMRLVGSPVHVDTLRWSIRCARKGEPLSFSPLDQAASRGWAFQVPGDCPAQWLELSGRAADVAQQAEATITGLSLSRGAGR